METLLFQELYLTLNTPKNKNNHYSKRTCVILMQTGSTLAHFLSVPNGSFVSSKYVSFQYPECTSN